MKAVAHGDFTYADFNWESHSHVTVARKQLAPNVLVGRIFCVWKMFRAMSNIPLVQRICVAKGASNFSICFEAKLYFVTKFVIYLVILISNLI